MKKKVLCMFLACAMTTAITGCGKEGSQKEQTSESGTTTSTADTAAATEEEVTSDVTVTDTTVEDETAGNGAMVNAQYTGEALYFLLSNDTLFYSVADKTNYVTNADGGVVDTFLVKELMDSIEDEELRTVIQDKGVIETIYKNFYIISVPKDYENESDLGKVYALNREDHSCQLIKEAGDYAQNFEIVNDTLYFMSDLDEYAFQYDEASNSFVEMEDPYSHYFKDCQDKGYNWLHLEGTRDNCYSVSGAMDRFGYVIAEKYGDYYILKGNGEEEKINIGHQMYSTIPLTQDYILNADDVNEDGYFDDQITLYQISTQTEETLSFKNFECIGINENGFYFAVYEDENPDVLYGIHYFDYATKQDTFITDVPTGPKSWCAEKVTMIEDKLFIPLYNGSEYIWTQIHTDGVDQQMKDTGTIVR